MIFSTQAVGFAEEHYIKAFENFVAWIENVRVNFFLLFSVWISNAKNYSKYRKAGHEIKY